MTDMSINQVCLRTLAHPHPAALETYLSVGKTSSNNVQIPRNCLSKFDNPCSVGEEALALSQA